MSMCVPIDVFAISNEKYLCQLLLENTTETLYVIILYTVTRATHTYVHIMT